jgi:hypothetical protein
MAGVLIGCAGAHDGHSAAELSPYHGLYVMPTGIQTRWASAENWKGEKGVGGQMNAGRKGSPAFALKAGDSKVLAEVQGQSGMVRRIWTTISERDSKMLRSLRLDMYWDGAETPAVSAPMGDFYCQPLGRMTTFQNALFSNPEGRSFNCCIPMPFKTGMKIVVTNEGDQDVRMFFYDVNYTLGDQHGEDMLYFHAHWRRENPTTMQKDFELLPRVEGKGRFLGVNIGVAADTEQWYKSWWGEGEVKAYLDGDREFPTLCGTGTEDYIGTAWGQGQYHNLYQGCHIADGQKFEYGFYRLHIPDPVFFYEDIRVTIQQIGCWGPDTKKLMHESGREFYAAGPGLKPVDLSPEGPTGPYGLFERTDDWSSCAYFYLDTPTNDLPPLAPVAERVADLE